MSNSPESVPLRVAAKTAEAALVLLERLATAAERTAAALEAYFELAAKAANPEHLSAADVRSANRANLLLLADKLGVTEWADEQGIDLSKESTPWLRGWCLKAHAGEELTHARD